LLRSRRSMRRRTMEDRTRAGIVPQRRAKVVFTVKMMPAILMLSVIWTFVWSTFGQVEVVQRYTGAQV
jgi:hypothetical protein